MAQMKAYNITMKNFDPNFRKESPLQISLEKVMCTRLVNVECCDHLHDFHFSVGTPGLDVLPVADQELDQFTRGRSRQQRRIVLFGKHHSLVPNNDPGHQRQDFICMGNTSLYIGGDNCKEHFFRLASAKCL